MARTWDAQTYHRVSEAMDGMAGETLERLDLRGDEVVLDAGCGTGRITERLLERLPKGRVMAVDADPEMVVIARDTLPAERVDVRHLDLLDLDEREAFDAIFSTATFHWVPDHDRLFANLFRALRPGGRLVAQCGGRGNIDAVLDAGDAVAADPEWAGFFTDFDRLTHFADPEDTARRLTEAGFEDARCWLQPFPVRPDDPVAYLETITCGPHVQRLPADRRRPFAEAVADRLGPDVVIDYVRLNLEARRPE